MGTGRVAVVAVLVTAAAGCGSSFVRVRPSEGITAAAPASGVRAEVTSLFLTEDVRTEGLDDDSALVVELRVTNDGSVVRKLSPGSFSCLMAVDARRPAETRALLPGGGGEGAFPGAMPDEGSLLLPVSIPPGQSRVVWALFRGYRFEGSEVPRRVTLRAPVEGGAPLELVLADPARGALRWQTPPLGSTWSIGVKNVSLLAPGMGGPAPSTEIVRVARQGPFLWDIGLVSTLFAETQGHRLKSETNMLTGSGLTMHLTLPLLSWGSAQSPRQLGVYGGGTTSLLVEIPRPRAAGDMTPLNVYGFVQAEAGLELDAGALHLARTPFPLVESGRPLPRWTFRLGYIQTWAGGATSAGYGTTIRFSW